MPLVINTPLEKPPQEKPVNPRTKADLADPSKPADAEVNRLTKNTYTRLADEFLGAAEQIARKYGLTRSKWLELMMQRAVEAELSPRPIQMAGLSLIHRISSARPVPHGLISIPTLAAQPLPSLTKPFRKRDELPDPSQPSTAEVNRKTKIQSLRLPWREIQMAKAIAESYGVTRTQYQQVMLSRAIQAEAYRITPDQWKKIDCEPD